MAKYGKRAAEGKSLGRLGAAALGRLQPRRVWQRPMGVVAVACLLAAVASLPLPLAPSYDPWSWLVWGRELAALELDTSGGPSFKPLPVLAAAVLSPLGDAAPELWLVVGRTAWLLSLALAWRLAARLAPPGASRLVRAAAGAVAAASLLLLSEPQTAWLRHFAHGFSEPLLVALLLGAVDRHFDDRPGQVLGLLLAASLLRPEVWPFLLAFAAVAWRARTSVRPAALGALAAVPIVWLGGDWLGSGGPLTGGDRARVDDLAPTAGDALDRIWTVVEQAATLPPPPVWAAAVLGVALAWARGRRIGAVLLGAALAWIAAVAAEVVLGYAPLARFLVPAAALACVLGGAGVGWLWSEATSRTQHRMVSSQPRAVASAAAVLLLAAAAVPYAVARVAALPDHYDAAVQRANDVAAPTAAVAAAGRDAVVRCGRVVVEDFSLTPVLAWELELPLGDVDLAPSSGRIDAGAVVARQEGALARRVATQRPEANRIAAAGDWTVLSLPCLP